MLDDRTALVTGSSKGVGRGIAEELGSRGATVAVNYHRDQAAAEETLRSIREEGGDGGIYPCDVAEPGPVQSMIDSIHEELGGPDIVVSNAFEALPRGVLEVSPEEFQRGFNVSCSAMLYLAQAVHPIMKETGWGRMIAISSIASEVAMENCVPFGMAKAALERLAKQIARERGPDGIRCNVVRSGVVDTHGLQQMHPHGDTADVVREVAELTSTRGAGGSPPCPQAG